MTANIGENIKKLRSEKSVTQEQLAEFLSITYQSVSKWENNITSPDLYLIPAIAEFFEVSIDDLFKVNMSGYRNKAARLCAVFEHSRRKIDFEKADEEYEKLFLAGAADDEDMRIYGTLNHTYSRVLAEKAEGLLKKSVELCHETADADLMRLLADVGRNGENIELYEQSVAANPENARNHLLLSISYQRSKLYGEALTTVQLALEKFPADARLLCQCGEVHGALRQYDEAFICWNKSYELEPSIITNQYSMAAAYTELGKYEEAAAAWRKVIAFCEFIDYTEEAKLPKQELAKLQKLIGSGK
jgi:Predicted transcriptional regulators